MIQTLVIYDNEGIIFSSTSHNFIIPSGLQHMIVDVPQGKRIASIDVSDEEHVAIFEDIPKSEVEILQQELSEATMLLASQQEQIDNANMAISELTMLIAGGDA